MTANERPQQRGEPGRPEQRQKELGGTSELDKRYGRIGISAVAGAVRHKAVERPSKGGLHYAAFERD